MIFQSPAYFPQLWHDYLCIKCMGLNIYKKKRSFTHTPEPEGGRSKAKSLQFVVQKHDASHLHYDFRLEMEGVLKSWAVPKGPSLDPAQKRLAVMVEDHPYNYRRFEGTIPEGHYGAGTVEIWDHGTYMPAEAGKDKKEDERTLLRQLKKGKLTFILHGDKLRGEFSLVKMKQAEKNQWLLIKHQDQYATEKDILRSPKTVKKKSAPRKSAVKKKAVKRKKRKSSTTDIPGFIPPMLATASATIPSASDARWLYEIKWDGYRVVASCNNDSVHLYSRNNQVYDERFYPVRDALLRLKLEAVLDGEVCVLNKKGYPRFGDLQNWRSEKDGQLVYYAFDMLWLHGRDTTGLTLSERRSLLKELLPANTVIHYSDNVKLSLLRSAQKKGLEGLIAKKNDSLYTPGIRSRDWLKLKIRNRHEVILGGFTHKKDSPRAFSSLLAGVYKGNKLIYAGRIGTGFPEPQQQKLMKKMQSLATDNCPFVFRAEEARPRSSQESITWVRPVLVAEVNFTELTSDGLMRHASFEGLRDDKTGTSMRKESTTTTQTSKPLKMANRPASFLQDTDGQKKVTLLVDKKELLISNPDKLYWPDDGITKKDLLNYYHSVASYILPYIVNRPQSLYRFPHGIKQKGFYQKDVTGKVPEWIYQYPYTTEGARKHFLVPQSEADLIYMANLGTIEINPWSSTIKHPDHPTWCLLDLDPGSKSSFENVITVARVIRNILEELKIEGYPKTSGSTGLHIYLPLGEKYTYEESQLFARLIATEAESRLPEIATTERMIRKRRGRLYIDFLQNRPSATLAAPYSVRPKPEAPVSMPLHWDEVKKGLRITNFTLRNALKRIKKEGDLFKPVLQKGINIKKILPQFSDKHPEK